MCLFVKDIPLVSYNLVVEGYKFLDIEYYTQKLKTPYQDTIVPDDGLIISQNDFKEILYNDTLYGEVVHCSQYKTFTYKYLSFAIGVVAYGKRDIGSVALYIPEADKNTYRAKFLVPLLRAITKRPKRKSDKNMILSYFPELNKKLEVF